MHMFQKVETIHEIHSGFSGIFLIMSFTFVMLLYLYEGFMSKNKNYSLQQAIEIHLAVKGNCLCLITQSQSHCHYPNCKIKQQVYSKSIQFCSTYLYGLLLSDYGNNKIYIHDIYNTNILFCINFITKAMSTLMLSNSLCSKFK